MTPPKGSSGKGRGQGKAGKPRKSRPGKVERSGTPRPARATGRRPDRERETVSGKEEVVAARRGPQRRADGGEVCVVVRQGRFLVAEPFFARGDPHTLGRDGAEDGELVLVIPEGGTEGPPRIAERLGSPEIAADVIAALLLERDLAPKHTPEVLAAAAAAVHAPDPAQRRDLRELPTFTIDPISAKDYDDAISAEHTGGEVSTVFVHIADVTSFAPEGGIIDRAGKARATSTYVPGLVVPMLPPQLADDACSLVPGVDRRAVTVEMRVDAGRCVRAEVYRSLICSDARLHYDQVDEIFAGTEQPHEHWADSLAVARKVASELLVLRPQALELDIPEPEFKFDPSGAVVSQRQSEQTESHKLIEQLMVLANEQVARILQANGAPALYRIHEKPEAEAAEKLIDQMVSLGVHTPPVPENMSPSEAAELVAACSREVGAAVRRVGQGSTALPLLILRALKQALYDPACQGHAGLGLTHYCHFTSPIRRYPDIVCHRSILELAERGKAIIGAEDGSKPAAGARDPEDALSELAKHCSDEERGSMAVEREADRIAKAFLLRDYLHSGGYGEVWRGEVTGMIQPGMFVRFGGGFDGMIPLRSLKGDWWELNPEGTAFYAHPSGNVIRLGDRTEVTVDRVDVSSGKVDLVALRIGGDLD